jgi:type IV secretion system protein VirB8
MLFKRKEPAVADSQKEQSPIHRARDFLRGAKEFEESRIEQALASRKIAWRFAGAGVVVGILGLACVPALLPLKTVEHWLIRVDNNTGAVDVVRSLDGPVTDLPEVVDRSQLAGYVLARESYDWETIQAMYDKVALLSAPVVQSEYQRLWSAPNAPHRVIKNQFKVLVRNPSVSFVGDVAQVRFEKYIVSNTGELAAQQSESTKWIATVGYKYANPPMTDAQRLINPLGFQVTSYRVDPENIK